MGLLEGYFVPLYNFFLTPENFDQKVKDVTDRQSVCRLAFWCCTDNLQRLHKPLLQEPRGVCDGDVHSWDTDQSFDGAQTEEVFLLLFSGPQRLLLV